MHEIKDSPELSYSLSVNGYVGSNGKPVDIFVTISRRGSRYITWSRNFIPSGSGIPFVSDKYIAYSGKSFPHALHVFRLLCLEVLSPRHNILEKDLGVVSDVQEVFDKVSDSIQKEFDYGLL